MINIQQGKLLDEWVDFGGKKRMFLLKANAPNAPTVYVDGKANLGQPFGPIRERHHLTTLVPALRDITLTVAMVEG